MPDRLRGCITVKSLEDIFSSDLPEMERLAHAFRWITGTWADQAGREIEALKVLGDHDGLVREQIKMSVMKHAQSIFEHCYLQTTGRRPWDDQDKLRGKP